MVAESTWGVVAATAAPLAMATGFVIWDKRWEEGSGFALNCYKCALASVGFFVVVASMGGLAVSGENGDVTARNRSLLVLSGFIGIVLGDTAWLISLKEIGAHRTIVVDAIKPFVSALFSLVILDEKLTAIQIVGMAICLCGISVVSLERTKKSDEEENDSKEDAPGDATVRDISMDIIVEQDSRAVCKIYTVPRRHP